MFIIPREVVGVFFIFTAKCMFNVLDCFYPSMLQFLYDNRLHICMYYVIIPSDVFVIKSRSVLYGIVF